MLLSEFDSSLKELRLETDRERQLERSTVELEKMIEQLQQRILELENKPQAKQQSANSGKFYHCTCSDKEITAWLLTGNGRIRKI